LEHLALYREWRPQYFRDVVGQEHVSRTLRNAVREGRIAHAYLFCGPRGTGKTSTARILAKAVNCPQGREGEPCNQCVLCESITAGTALDVVEMDAASHRGIEEIRDLKQRVGFAPAAGRFKFYIIDEVHMLTGEAFNALLKTLEEPPRHAVFVLATTEVHKVPPTISSRCQRFDFRRLGREAIRNHLARIAREKGWEVDAEALTLLSRQAGGALRDALGLLDQAASFAGGRITRGDVEALIGALREDVLQALVSAVGSGDISALLNHLESLFAQGYEPRQLLLQLTDHVRELLFHSGTPEADVRRYAAFMRGLAVAEGEMRGSSRPELILELALLRLAGARLLPAQDILSPAGAHAAQETPAPRELCSRAEARAVQGENRGPERAEIPEPAGETKLPQEPRAAASERSGGSAAPGKDGERPAPDRGEEQQEKKTEQRKKQTGDAFQGGPEAIKNSLCARFQKQPLLAQVLAGCKFKREGNKIMVTPPSSFAQELLQKEENRRVLQEAVRQCGGDVLELEFSSEGRRESRASGLQSEAGWEKQPRRVEKDRAGTPAGGERKAGLRKEQRDSEGDPVGMALSLFRGEIITQSEAEGD